jgi:ketosteroid isomerase-like protein
MAKGDIQIVRQCYDVFARRRGIGLSDWLELFDPDVAFDMSRRVFNPYVYRGYEGFRQVMKSVDEVWTQFEVVPTEVFQAPQHVFAEVRIAALGNSSGVGIDMPLYDIWTLRDGKALLMRAAYRDHREALEAAGLPDG